jgi:hypothetical protein
LTTIPRLAVSPFEVALIITPVLTGTSTALTRKVPVWELTGMVIVETSGVATAGLVLDKLTTMGAGPAGHSRLTVAIDVPGPGTASGESASAAGPIGRTDNAAVLVKPA